ncbi:hypothetical protein BDV09DRAFT_157125 [Aspergillus tetrazonus]
MSLHRKSGILWDSVTLRLMPTVRMSCRHLTLDFPSKSRPLSSGFPRALPSIPFYRTDHKRCLILQSFNCPAWSRPRSPHELYRMAILTYRLEYAGETDILQENWLRRALDHSIGHETRGFEDVSTPEDASRWFHQSSL